MNMNGFYKVGQTGGSYVVAHFYNPETGEEFSKCVRDYDYADGSRDDDTLYNMPIDKAAQRAWYHKHGNILTGDTIKVVKGRKVKVGTIAKVVEIKPVNDRYGRWVADYAHLDNGERTNITNCELVG